VSLKLPPRHKKLKAYTTVVTKIRSKFWPYSASLCSICRSVDTVPYKIILRSNVSIWAIPLCCITFNKVFHSILTHNQYIVSNTPFWLHVSFLPNHLLCIIYHKEVHSVCTYIMGSHSVYIKSYQFNKLILS
jgi:hypothetical protein